MVSMRNSLAGAAFLLSSPRSAACVSRLISITSGCSPRRMRLHDVHRPQGTSGTSAPSAGLGRISPGGGLGRRFGSGLGGRGWRLLGRYQLVEAAAVIVSE